MAWTSRSQYEELQELGRGGFGQAKLVRKIVGTGQLFVVKEVNLAKVAESCGDDPSFIEKVLEMTKLEAANMMSLQHDNIVRVFGYFEETYLKCSYYHIVMEYCELGDLGKAIREALMNKTPFEEKQIRRWSRQLSSALKFLHDNKFVHRDIKPANIFLASKRYSVKLGDFGLGKQVDKIAQSKTSITTIGTEAYCSPEVLQMQPYTEKSDIWAFGVVVYEMTALKRPFGPTVDRPVTFSILHCEPSPLPQQYSSVIRNFVDLLLTKDPAKRPSMAEIVEHRAVSHAHKDSNANNTSDSPASATSAEEKVAALEPKSVVASDTSKPANESRAIVTAVQKTTTPSRNDNKKVPLMKPSELSVPKLQVTPSSTTTALPTVVSIPPSPQTTSPVANKQKLPTAPRLISEAEGLPSADLRQPVPPTSSPPEQLPVKASLPSPGISSATSPMTPKALQRLSISGGDSADTLILRKDTMFAVKPVYQRSSSTAMAPKTFTMNKMPSRDDANPLRTTLLAKKSRTFEDQLQKYEERTRIFQNIDRYAYDVSQTSHKTFRDLIWDLIFSQGIIDDYEKVRALFLWLCSKDLSTIDFASPGPDTPEKVLMDLKKGARNYASVFELMCSYSGLQCSIIYGFAKGVKYKLGMNFDENTCNHSWCAVLVDGQWRFFDPEWASRVMLLKTSQMRYELDEFYFMPPPEQFIYTHYPSQSKWQLLPTTVSLNDFENMPFLSSLFFKRHLALGPNSQQLTLVVGNDDTDKITLEIKGAKAADLNFIYKLVTENNENQEDIVVNGKRISLGKCVYHEVDYSGRKARFTIRPPLATNYEFTVYGLPLSAVADVTTTNNNSQVTYNAVAEWKIVAKTASNKIVLFPLCSPSGRWGGLTDEEAAKRGISKLPSQGKLLADQNGTVEVVLNKSATAATKAIDFSYRLIPAEDTYDTETLKHCVMLRVFDNKAVFLVSLPGKGDFGLELFSSLPGEVGKESLPHLCQYLLTWASNEINDAKPTKQHLCFPVMASNYLGPQKIFYEIGLKPVSHKDPYIAIASWSLPLEIVFESPKLLNASANLHWYSSGQPDKKYPQFVLHQYVAARKHESFMCRFPQPGMYRLELYAKLAEVEGGGLPNIFNYLINVGGAEPSLSGNYPSPLQFPKQYNQWRGGHLAEPLNGILKRFESGNAGSELKSVRVRLAIQGVFNVAALVKEKWIPLNLGKDGYWQVDINLQDVWTSTGNDCTLVILANANADQPKSFSTLLEYQLSPHN